MKRTAVRVIDEQTMSEVGCRLPPEHGGSCAPTFMPCVVALFGTPGGVGSPSFEPAGRRRLRSVFGRLAFASIPTAKRFDAPILQTGPMA